MLFKRKKSNCGSRVLWRKNRPQKLFIHKIMNGCQSHYCRIDNPLSREKKRPHTIVLGRFQGWNGKMGPQQEEEVEWAGLGSGHMSKSQPFFSHNDFVVVAKRRPNKTARKKDVNFSSSFLCYIPIYLGTIWLYSKNKSGFFWLLLVVLVFEFIIIFEYNIHKCTYSRKTILHLLIKVKSYEKVT